MRVEKVRQGKSHRLCWGPQSPVLAPTPSLCQPCVGVESVNARLVHARRILHCCATFQHPSPLFGDRVSLCNSDWHGTSCGPGLTSKFSCLNVPSAGVTSMHHNTQLPLEWRYKVHMGDLRRVRHSYLALRMQDTGTQTDRNKEGWHGGRKITSAAWYPLKARLSLRLGQDSQNWVAQTWVLTIGSDGSGPGAHRGTGKHPRLCFQP